MSKKEVFYVIKGNTDQTEGRGTEVDRELFSSIEAAMVVVRKGTHAVMGVPMHQKLYQRTLEWQADGRITIQDALLWGHHRSRDGKWRYEWVDDRDVEKFNDPEFAEYVRLREKFDGKS